MAATPPAAPPLPAATLLDANGDVHDNDCLVHHVPELFSPGSRSAETNGTGATGSTEPVGAATRSLISSVDARQRRGASIDDAGDADSEQDVFGTPMLGSSAGTAIFTGASDASSWDRIKSPCTPAKTARQSVSADGPPTPSPFYLPTPEPEERFGTLRSSEDVRADREMRPAPTADRRETDSQEDDHRVINGTDGGSLKGGLTDSQEDVLLAQSVTRSQSDFSHWLEETLRLAKGDGTSTIESDDALSSILEATRHVRRSGGNSGLALSHTTEQVSLVDFGEGALPEEDITISTLPSALREPVGEEAVAEPDVRVALDPTNEAPGSDESSSVSSKPSASSRGPTRPWQMLSFILATSIAYDRYTRQTKPAASLATIPSRSLAYAPTNQTILVSHFPTPIPVGSHLSSLWIASICSVLALLGAGAPWVMKFARPGSFAPQSDTPARLRSPSLDALGLAKARELLQVGIVAYGRSDLKAAQAAFAAVLDCTCPATEKAPASEWLGRALYRLARVHGDDRQYLQEAATAFERSIRLNAQRATSRASLGRTLYRLGDYPKAVESLQHAIRRDDRLAFAYEWLAKALSRLAPCNGPLVERYLRQALELDPHSYTTYGFLGEYLHVQGGGRSTAEAREALLKAVAFRYDYPAAHLRLAYIATEQMDGTAAARHFAAAIETRRAGMRDFGSMPMSERAVDGPTPYLAWYFAEPSTSPRRPAILESALVDHPHDELIGLLQALESGSNGVSLGPAQASPLSEVMSSQLEQRLSILSKRTQRFAPNDDPMGHGLYALALLAVGRSREGKQAYSRFWTAVVERRRQSKSAISAPAQPAPDEAEFASTIAFLAMAFFGRRATFADPPRPSSALGGPAIKSMRTPSPRKKHAKEVASALKPAPASAPVAKLRRSPRNIKASPCTF